jgi:hypothetical protein
MVSVNGRLVRKWVPNNYDKIYINKYVIYYYHHHLISLKDYFLSLNKIDEKECLCEDVEFIRIR